MNDEEPIKIRPYYGLRLASLIYKVLAVLTVIVVLGALGYISIAAVNSPLPDNVDFQIWAQQAPGLLIVGLLSFTFFVLAQIIDVQMGMNEKLRQMLKQNQEIHRSVEIASKLMVTQSEHISKSLQLQARLVRLQEGPKMTETSEAAKD